jgi:lantibiotic modifying enzyme
MSATGELLRRLAEDRNDLEDCFGCGSPLGQVRRVDVGLSDPHDGGRTVALVTFEHGLRVVYKPRPVGLESAYYELVQWWNRVAGGLDLRAARMLPCATHGWAEFIEETPCADEVAARRYYERAGVLICLAWLLDATDLHHGNLIAHGDHPVLVDLETLLQPRWRGEERSLLDTGLVPCWIRGPDGRLHDVSGLGAMATQRFAGKEVPMQRNILRIENGAILSPARFSDRIVAGFRRAAAVVITRREELLDAAGPLIRFSGQPVRVILRHSLTYRQANKASEPLRPESLLRPVFDAAALEAITRVEHQALLCGDIPRFTAVTDNADWTLDRNVTISRYFAQPSYDLLVERIRRIEMPIVEEQARLLTSALDLWHLPSLLTPVERSSRRRLKGMTPSVKKGKEDAVEERRSRKEEEGEISHPG